MGGAWSTQLLYVAAELDLARHLAEPLDAPSLAARVGAEPLALERLLRALASLGLLREEGGWRLEPAGEELAEDRLRPWILWWGREGWGLWGGLLDRVRGAPPRGRGFAHLGDPARAALFHAAMAALSRGLAAELDPGPARRIVDVGGGQGGLLLPLLARGEAEGLLFDEAHAQPAARAAIAAAGLAGRCRFVAGDFFASVPAGDLLLLKSVLHDWEDPDARRILAACRAALLPGGRLWLIEREPSPALDLHMLLAFGSRQREEAELQALLRSAGFVAQARRVGGFFLFEARADGDQVDLPVGEAR